MILIGIDTEWIFVCCFSFLIPSSVSCPGKQTFILVVVKVLQRRLACLTCLASKCRPVDYNWSDFVLFNYVLKWNFFAVLVKSNLHIMCYELLTVISRLFLRLRNVNLYTCRSGQNKHNMYIEFASTSVDGRQ